MPTIPSCLKGKVLFLVINVLNDYCICMWLIVCMYAGISGRNSVKGGRTVKPGKSVLLLFFFFLKMSESVILVGTVQTKP